jgi:hypothetical protein
MHILTRAFVRPIVTTLLVATLWAPVEAAVGCADPSPGPDQTEARVSAAMAGLNHYRETGSLSDLQQVVEHLGSAVVAPNIRIKDATQRRRTVVRAWGRLFSIIDSLIDPTFDVNDPRIPQPPVVPPPPRDPQTEAAYAAALKDIAAQKRRLIFQRQARDVEHIAMILLRSNLADFYGATPPDREQLDRILRETNVTESRRLKIEALI